VAAELSAGAGAKLIALADQSFVDAMNSASSIAAAVALVGAFVALAFLPSRARKERAPATEPLPEPASA
jgi:hypothetical protein